MPILVPKSAIETKRSLVQEMVWHRIICLWIYPLPGIYFILKTPFLGIGINLTRINCTQFHVEWTYFNKKTIFPYAEFPF